MLDVKEGRSKYIHFNWLRYYCIFSYNSVLVYLRIIDFYSITSHNGSMRIIVKRRLREFWSSNPKYADSKASLEAWHEEVSEADWENPQQVKSQFRHASILKDSRVVFNIKGNNYRLVAKINYPYRIVYVRFLGTHQQYDEIDVETI